MRDKRRKSTTPGSEPAPAATGAGELPERWSVQRKTELVLRLLRGEALLWSSLAALILQLLVNAIGFAKPSCVGLRPR